MTTPEKAASMTMRKLHPDWPEADLTGDRWDYPAPLSDLAYALTEGPETTTATPLPEITGRIALADIAEVERYYVSYHGLVWTPDNDADGSELDMVLLMRLHDGRWASVTAWNDYTGWGCQDASYVKVGATRDDVIRYGLDNEGRERLRIQLPPKDNES